MTELLGLEFFRNALIGVVLIAVASAVIGTYVFARRMVAIAGGLTHACFGGLGLGYFLGISPIAMAAAFAVGSSLGIEWLSRRHRVRSDSAIAVVWGLGMAVGVLFVFLTPGYVPELNAFLFGNILTITHTDLWEFAAFTAMLLAYVGLRYRYVVACAFDPDFARVAGLPVVRVATVMTVLTAVCIVMTIKLVGVMLLVSMISLPQMVAETFRHRIGPLMVASAIVSVLCCVGGLLAGCYIDVPCSALIVIIMAVAFVVARLGYFLNTRRRAVCDTD